MRIVVRVLELAVLCITGSMNGMDDKRTSTQRALLRKPIVLYIAAVGNLPSPMAPAPAATASAVFGSYIALLPEARRKQAWGHFEQQNNLAKGMMPLAKAKELASLYAGNNLD